MKLRRVKADDLKIGMFIVNPACSRFKHPFLRNKLSITSPRQLEKLRQYGILEVCIDIERSLGFSDLRPMGKASPTPPPESPIKKPTLAKTNESIELEAGKGQLSADEIQVSSSMESLGVCRT